MRDQVLICREEDSQAVSLFGPQIEGRSTGVTLSVQTMSFRPSKRYHSFNLKHDYVRQKNVQAQRQEDDAQQMSQNAQGEQGPYRGGFPGSQNAGFTQQPGDPDGLFSY